MANAPLRCAQRLSSPFRRPTLHPTAPLATLGLLRAATAAPEELLTYHLALASGPTFGAVALWAAATALALASFGALLGARRPVEAIFGFLVYLLALLLGGPAATAASFTAQIAAQFTPEVLAKDPAPAFAGVPGGFLPEALLYGLTGAAPLGVTLRRLRTDPPPEEGAPGTSAGPDHPAGSDRRPLHPSGGGGVGGAAAAGTRRRRWLRRWLRGCRRWRRRLWDPHWPGPAALLRWPLALAALAAPLWLPPLVAGDAAAALAACAPPLAAVARFVAALLGLLAAYLNARATRLHYQANGSVPPSGKKVRFEPPPGSMVPRRPAQPEGSDPVDPPDPPEPWELADPLERWLAVAAEESTRDPVPGFWAVTLWGTLLALYRRRELLQRDAGLDPSSHLWLGPPKLLRRLGWQLLLVLTLALSLLLTAAAAALKAWPPALLLLLAPLPFGGALLRALLRGLLRLPLQLLVALLRDLPRWPGRLARGCAFGAELWRGRRDWLLWRWQHHTVAVGWCWCVTAFAALEDAGHTWRLPQEPDDPTEAVTPLAAGPGLRLLRLLVLDPLTQLLAVVYSGHQRLEELCREPFGQHLLNWPPEEPPPWFPPLQALVAALLLLAAFAWSLYQLGRPRRLALLWLPPLLLLPSATAWLLLGWQPLLELVGLVGVSYCRQSARLLAGPVKLALLVLPSLLALLLLPLQLPLAVLVTLLEAAVEAHWERSPESAHFWSRNLACFGTALLFYAGVRGLWALNHPRRLRLS